MTGGVRDHEVGAPSGVFVTHALDALMTWRVPTTVIGWLRDDVFHRLVADAEPGEPQITWSVDDAGWRSSALGDHMSAPSPADLLPETLIAINRAAASSVADHCLVLHAGVFAVQTTAGLRAVAVCGASGSGKSTATAAAALSGHGFVADEVCALTPGTWDVRPYLRPIGLRPGGAAALGVTTGGPFDDEGSPSRVWHAPTAIDRSVPLALVALVDRRPGDTVLEVLRPAEALEMLVNQTLATEGRTREMFRRTEQLVRQVPVAKLGYEDVFQAIEVVAQRVRVPT